MKEVKFLKKGIKIDGVYHPVWYSMGSYGPLFPAGTITIYAKNYGHIFGTAFANVENGTEIETDYFEKDHVRILPSDKHYAAVLKASGKTL